MFRAPIVFFLTLLVFVNQLFAVTVDTIQLDVVSEGYHLDAVMLKQTASNKKLPVIIFLVGSAGNSSHKTTYKDFTEFFFENTFLKNGFAVVYFDKRGVGKSEGKWYETTFEQRALDAKNVALAIRQFDFVDQEKLFVVGHSQGGWIVQVAVANYPEIFAGGISMAGPVFGVRKQLINDYQSKFICAKGWSAPKAYRKAKAKTNRNIFFSSVFGKKGNLKQLTVIKKFEPRPYLVAVRKPLLLLFAENDALVNSKWCFNELKTIFPEGLPSAINVHESKGETHSFKIAPFCYKGERVTRYYSEATQQKIYEWTNAVLGATSGITSNAPENK